MIYNSGAITIFTISCIVYASWFILDRVFDVIDNKQDKKQHNKKD